MHEASKILSLITLITIRNIQCKLGVIHRQIQNQAPSQSSGPWLSKWRTRKGPTTFQKESEEFGKNEGFPVFHPGSKIRLERESTGGLLQDSGVS